MLDVLRQLEAAALQMLRQRRTCVDVGPFRTFLDPDDAMIWLNYAAPVQPLGSAIAMDAALRELRGVFQQRQRTPRFEFTAALWPGLPEHLLRNGYKLQAEQPL